MTRCCLCNLQPSVPPASRRDWAVFLSSHHVPEAASAPWQGISAWFGRAVPILEPWGSPSKTSKMEEVFQYALTRICPNPSLGRSCRASLPAAASPLVGSWSHTAVQHQSHHHPSTIPGLLWCPEPQIWGSQCCSYFLEVRCPGYTSLTAGQVTCNKQLFFFETDLMPNHLSSY